LGLGRKGCIHTVRTIGDRLQIRPRGNVGGAAFTMDADGTNGSGAANWGHLVLQSRKYLSIAAGPMLRVTPPRFPRIGPPARRIRGRRQQACGSICLVM